MGKKSKFKARHRPRPRPRHNELGLGVRGSWKLEIEKENKLFENYYRAQNIIPTEEWEAFIAALRRDLPSTFRICGTKKLAKDLLGVLKMDYIKEMEGLKIEDEEIPSPAPLPWYPDELAWESKLARRTIRKSTKLEKFHNFLVEESNCGAITRQEAVSMIPPLFLNVLPYHKVLDMCAAPGSKTTQLLEIMHSDEDGPPGEDSNPTGCVIANDVDNKRCYMLVHHSKRIQSPCCMVTNHDATIFPFPTKRECPGGKEIPIHFDRILCDVPCSGDGTLRKNPLIWARWSPHLGVSLHRLQTKILVRGLELLIPGGKLVYSTCSMNPIEDEAVVAEVIRKAQGAVQLIDVSSCLTKLKRSAGLMTWKVHGRNGEEYNTFEDADPNPKSGYKETMFPPTKEEANAMQLHKCVRVYPHQQDTGGFFIAVLTKTQSLPWEDDKSLWKMASRKFLPWEWLERKKNEAIAKKEIKQPDKTSQTTQLPDHLVNVTDASVSSEQNKIDNEETKNNSEMMKKKNGDKGQNRETEPPKKKRKMHGFKEDPYVFLEEDDEHLIQIKDFYKLTSVPTKQLLVRSNDTGAKKRNIYLVSESVREILENNVEVWKIINTGVKVLTRCGLKSGKQVGCDFRITQEGLHVFHCYVGKRTIEIEYSDMVILLTQGEPYQTKMSKSTIEQLDEMGPGCLIWHYKVGITDAERTLSSDIYICGFKGKVTVRCMMAREERMHLLRVLGLPTATVMKLKGENKGKGGQGDTVIVTVPGSDEDGVEADVDEPFSDEEEQNVTTDINKAATHMPIKDNADSMPIESEANYMTTKNEIKVAKDEQVIEKSDNTGGDPWRYLMKQNSIV